MKEAVIVSTARTGLAKSVRGGFNITHGAVMAGHAIKNAIARAKIDPGEVEDVFVGCANPEGATGFNIARLSAIEAGCPVTTAGTTINRFCSSGLQAIALACQRIAAGYAEVIVAGGTESMSLIPRGGYHFSPNPYLMEHYPDSYLTMGLTAENLAAKHEITREEQDRFSLRSHQRAMAAIEEGKFRDEIVPLEVIDVSLNGGGKPQTRKLTFDTDEGPRRDTSLEALAKLKPAFHAHGTVTAGNSSQMSDGAAAAVVMPQDRALALGLAPLARLVSFATAGCPPEEMGAGPVFAIPKVLKQAGLTLAEIDVIELNEAFAAQALSVIKLADLDADRTNVNGGAIALGHPLGCTGAKLAATLLGELKRRRARYGMVTMCVGGGMGAAGIFENL